MFITIQLLSLSLLCVVIIILYYYDYFNYYLCSCKLAIIFIVISRKVSGRFPEGSRKQELDLNPKAQEVHWSPLKY